MSKWSMAGLVALVAVAAACARMAPGSADAVDAAVTNGMTSQQVAQLRIGVDSFAIRFRGLPEGWQRLELQQVADGYRYTEEVVLGDDLRRSITVLFDRYMIVRSVTSSGFQFGHRTSVEIVYQGHEAKGSSRVVRNSVPRDVVIDTVLPDAAFDGMALLAILPALPWSPGQRYRLTMFDTDEGSVTDQVLDVVGVESVTVPAGEFIALRGELTTTQLPVTIWVTQDIPRRILKLSSRNGDTVLIK